MPDADVVSPPPFPDAEAFGERMVSSILGAFECFAFYVGDRLGWLRALADTAALNPAELAGTTGTAERYCREWLEMLAANGVLGVRLDGRFFLPPGAAEVLVAADSVAYQGPFPRMLAAVGVHLPELLDAYKTGGGVSWATFADDAREAQADLNRPWFEQQLAPALASAPELHSRLNAPDAAIADVGCGFGWSTLALGRAYPQAHLLGVDVDGPSIAAAGRATIDAGLTDRVRFVQAGGSGLGREGPFDVVFFFECVHDMADPVSVLRGAAEALKPGGVVIVVDEAVAEKFTAPGSEVDRFMYGCSMFICLPDGKAGGPSAETGTVMRPATLEKYGRQAGLTSFAILPIAGFGFFRFYRLAR